MNFEHGRAFGSEKEQQKAIPHFWAAPACSSLSQRSASGKKGTHTIASIRALKADFQSSIATS
jgi:hypothetical protein